jgi:hypothetical protein
MSLALRSFPSERNNVGVLVVRQGGVCMAYVAKMHYGGLRRMGYGAKLAAM